MKWFILLLLAFLKEEKKIQQRGGWGKSPNFLTRKQVFHRNHAAIPNGKLFYHLRELQHSNTTESCEMHIMRNSSLLRKKIKQFPYDLQETSRFQGTYLPKSGKKNPCKSKGAGIQTGGERARPLSSHCPTHCSFIQDVSKFGISPLFYLISCYLANAAEQIFLKLTEPCSVSTVLLSSQFQEERNPRKRIFFKL